MALRKRNADLLANQFDVDHGLPVSSLSKGLLGTHLRRDILALDGTMLELGRTKRTQANDAPWLVRPRCLGVRDQVNRFEVSSAVPPGKTIGPTANLAPASVFLVKEIPDGLVFGIPNIDHAVGYSLGSSWFSASPGHVILPCSLSTFLWIPNRTGLWSVIRDSRSTRLVERIVQGLRDIFRWGCGSRFPWMLLLRLFIFLWTRWSLTASLGGAASG